jgi:hypothetical protein
MAVLVIMSLPSPVPIKPKFSRVPSERYESAAIESLPSPKKTLPLLVNFSWEMMELLPASVSMVPKVSLKMPPMPVMISFPLPVLIVPLDEFEPEKLPISMPPIPVRMLSLSPVLMMPSLVHIMPEIGPVPIMLALPLSVLIAPL